MKWHHVCTSAQCVQIIRPCLHHLPALRQVLCRVIGSSYLVAFAVGKPALDRVAEHLPAILVRPMSRLHSATALNAA